MKETLWGEEHQETAFRFKYESSFLLLKVFLQKKFYPSFFTLIWNQWCQFWIFLIFFRHYEALASFSLYFFIFFYFTYQNFVYFRYAVERVNLDKRILKRWEDFKLYINSAPERNLLKYKHFIKLYIFNVVISVCLCVCPKAPWFWLRNYLGPGEWY